MLSRSKAENRKRMPLPRVTLPDDAIFYAIGDVHGVLDPLLAIEARILADGARFDCRKIIVMLGDYVDRGRQSCAVIDHLLKPLPAGFERLCLRGNHEQAMLAFLRDPIAHQAWLDMGGEATLASYQVNIRPILREGRKRCDTLPAFLREALPPAHWDFLNALPVLATGSDVAFVHAGIRPGIPLAEQDDRDLLWIREPFLSKGPQLPMIVVHGHTPGPEPVRVGNRIGIDTFAYSTGRLVALRIRGTRGAFLEAG